MSSRRRLSLLGLLGLCVALRAASLLRACLSDDEAIYAVVAREILRGQLLYRDVVDHKPPLIYMTYAATQALGGPRGGMFLIHVLTILVVFATAVLLRGIVRRHSSTDASAADFAALLYVVFTTTLLDFDSLAANCELFMLLPLVGSVATYLAAMDPAPRDSSPPRPPSNGSFRRPTLFAATGALVSIAALYKYQAAVQLPLYALHLAWTRRRELARVASALGAILAGLLLPLLLTVFVFHRSGGLEPAFFWLRFNFGYIRTGFDPGELVERAAIRISFVVLAALFLYALGARAAILALRARAPEATPLQRFAAAWLLVSLIGVSAGGRFFGHYFHQLTAPLAVLAAPHAASLWSAGGRRKALVTLGVAVPGAVFFLLAAFHTEVMKVAGDPDPDYLTMARAIRAQTAPSDAICIWGNSPVLYFEAERPLGCRFVFANYLSGLSPATRTQSDPVADASSNIVPEAWDMLEQDLRTRRPRLIIDASPGDVGHYGKFPPSHFPRLGRILDRDYEEVGTAGGIRILRRRPDPG